MDWLRLSAQALFGLASHPPAHPSNRNYETGESQVERSAGSNTDPERRREPGDTYQPHDSREQRRENEKKEPKKPEQEPVSDTGNDDPPHIDVYG